MSSNTPIIKNLENKGYIITKSNSGKIIADFDKSPTSKYLFKFLQSNPSCRVVFNAFVKSGTKDVNATLRILPKLLEEAKTSFVFEAHCKHCKAMLSRPHLMDRIPPRIQISCPKCNIKNIIEKKDLQLIFNPDIKDLIKMFFGGVKKRVLRPAYALRCYFCDYIALDLGVRSINAICPKCKKVMYVETQFFPPDEMSQLMTEQQGYWLEWYVWRLIHDIFTSDIGLNLKKGAATFECDCIILKNDKVIVIECKDSSDDDFLKKLIHIDEVADYFILITSVKPKLDTLPTVKRILKKKFIYVTSEKIEDLHEIIIKLK